MDYPGKLHGTRGKSGKEQKLSKPKRPATLDADDLELLDFLLREEEEHSKCWSVNETGETLAECGAGMGTSSVCQSRDRQQNLDRLLQLMSQHEELRDNEYYYTTISLLQVAICLCLSIGKLANSNLPVINIAGA